MQQPRTNRSGSVSSAVSLTANSTRNQPPEPKSQPKPAQVQLVQPVISASTSDLNKHHEMGPGHKSPEDREETQELTASRTEYTSYQDHERYIPQPDRVAMGTNTEPTEKPQAKRRTSVEAKKAEDTLQASENDTEADDNSSVVNQIVQENIQAKRSKRTDSESSNSSAYRKSVSFDLDHDNGRRSTNYCSGGSDAENDVFKPGQQRKGILRSPSPFLDREPKKLQTFMAVDTETDRENPFRAEFFRDEKEPGTKGRPASVYEPESPNWTFEQIKQKMESISRSTAELRQQQDQAQTDFKRQIEGAKSMGQINRGPKPPRPPKPLHIKKANLVYNEGIEDINRKMFQGDFVEFEHDARTNTIKEVQRPFSPEMQFTSPTPSTTGSLDSGRVSRQKSVERPKERPPPPPVAPPPPPKKVHSQDYEYVHIESLPLPQTPQWRNENSKVNWKVSQEEHRRIMLQENELRNSLQSDLNLVGLSGARVHDSDTESYLSSIAAEFSPVSTLQRPVSPLKLFPNVEKVPVQLKDLPSPQHPSFVRPKSQLVEEPEPSVGCQCKDTVSDNRRAEDSEDESTDDDGASDDGIDIDKYLPQDHANDDYYATATFSTFSGKETSV